MSKYKIGGLFVLSGALFSSNSLAQSSGSDVQKIISQERANQIARQISNNISYRVTGEVSGPNSLQPQSSLSSQNPLAASSDINALLPDQTWVSTSWSEISNDGIDAHVDADIYQVTGGIDKQFGDWFVGLSTTYAYTETEIGGLGIGGGLGGSTPGAQSDSHSVTVTPYAAFVFNQNFFISGFTSYSYTRDEPDVSGANLDSDTDEYTSELDLNGLKVLGDWTLIGKTGFRYSHRHTDFDKRNTGIGGSSSSDSWTYLLDAQVAYSLEHFVKGLRMSAGALYELEDGDDDGDGVLYMRTGLDYAVSKSLNVGINYSHDVNNEDIDINTVGLNLRLAL